MTDSFLKNMWRLRRTGLQPAADLVEAALARAGLTTPGDAARTGVPGIVGRLLKQGLPGLPKQEDAPPAPASLIGGSFTGDAGTRPYRLFVPPAPAAAPPLIVMLHGCTQSAEDFAAGTRMNLTAARAGALVLYPMQVASANPQRCWNWFTPASQQREGGEAALIAGMTREIMAAHHVDPRRVFVAGLSAGGAMAAIMGATYPDLFAAVGVHSGLASGAAADMAGAFAAMRQGRAGHGQHGIPTIIFHGDKDTTVNPRNAELVARQVSAGGAVATEAGQVPGGLAYTRRLERDAAGRVLVECWLVHGAAHAWSGGAPEGSYTEPQGPDASAAMLRFFLAAAPSG